MFDGIDSVPWSSLSHAYGSAEDVPNLLRDLRSDDPADRSHAFSVLFGNIYHQGTVYDATPHALPFLIELLGVIPPPDEAMLIALIAAIATGTGYFTAHVNPENQNEWDRRLAERDTTLNDELEHERRIVDAVRHEISKIIHLLAPYLEYEESEVRLTVAHALGKYRQMLHISLPALRAALLRETDEEVRAVIEESITELVPA